MADLDPHALPVAARIALAYSPAESRARLAIALGLDQRLGQIVARTSEPMLGQMRLAWWREALRQAPEARPRGDAVLDAVTQEWAAPVEPLAGLVDGWEVLLGHEVLDAAAAQVFAEARSEALLAACAIAPGDAGFPAARSAGVSWALGDLAAKVSSEAERAMLIEVAATREAASGRLPVRGRGIAVLGALGRRALKRGGRPLMEGRRAALTALGAAIFRR